LFQLNWGCNFVAARPEVEGEGADGVAGADVAGVKFRSNKDTLR
jgi:hypothetical protein